MYSHMVSTKNTFIIIYFRDFQQDLYKDFIQFDGRNLNSVKIWTRMLLADLLFQTLLHFLKFLL